MNQNFTIGFLSSANMKRYPIVALIFMLTLFSNNEALGQTYIINTPARVSSSSGSWTLGYEFTPNAAIKVTNFRTYFGTAVYLYDVTAATLVASQTVANANGTWTTQAALATPVTLTAGHVYKLSCYTGGGAYYWKTGGATTFANGTINGGYELSGNSNNPTTSDGIYWWYVDLVYCTNPVAGTLTQSPGSGGTVCTGTNVGYTLSGNSGYTSEYFQYAWNSSTPNSGSWGISGNGTNSGTWTSSPNGQVATLYVDAVLVNGACSTTTNVVNVVVDNVPTVGTLTQSPASGTAVCQGTNVNYTISGNSGYTSEYFQYQWNASPPNSGSWGITGNGTNSGTWGSGPNGAVATLYVDAVLTNGACTATTNIVNVVVDATSVAGTLVQSPASGGHVCTGSPVTYTTSGQTGTFQGYEYEWNGTGGYSADTWLTTNGGSWTSSSPGNTLYVQGVVQNGACAAVTTNVVTATVDATSVGGTLTQTPGTGGHQCTGSNVAYSLSGNNGTPYWYYTWSSGGTGTGWNNWGAFGSSYNWTCGINGSYPQLQVYTASTNGVCPAVASNTVLINVDAASSYGTITGTTGGNTAVGCAYSSGVVNQIALSGAIGTPEWYYETGATPAGGTPSWSGAWVAGTSAGTSAFPVNPVVNGGGAAGFEAIVTSGVCPSVTTPVIYTVQENNPPPTSLTASTTSYCSNAAPSTITLTATYPYGTNTFTNVLSNYSSINFYSGSCGGTLLATVAPSSITYGGSTATATYTFTAPSTPGSYTYYTQATSPGCTAGGCSGGSVAVNVIANSSVASVTGTSPICPLTSTTYSANTVVLGQGTGTWSTDNGSVATVNSSSGLVSGVAAGSCNVIYTITGGCNGTVSQQKSITISPAPASTPAYSTPITYCANTPITPNTTTNTGGAAVYTASSLPAGLSINSSTGTISGTPTTIAGIGATNYTVTATNTCGAPTQAVNITISGAAPGGLSYASNVTYCANNPITANTTNNTGGAAVFTCPTLPAGLTINSSTGTITGTPTTVGGIAATGYLVTATNSCGSASQTVVITIAPAVTATVTPTSASTYCSYANSGAITVSAAAGTPGYSYNWSGGLGTSSTASPTSSTATAYTATVTDNLGCTVTATTAAVTVNPAVTVSPSPAVTTKLCSYATNSAIGAGAGGGTSPYTYSWNNGLGSSSTGTPVITTGTVYIVTVTDSKGCTVTGSTGSISIDAIVTAVVSPTSTTTYCPYATSNVLSVTPGGGTGAYTYAWNNSLGTGATATPTSTSSIVYTATVTDNNGCTASANTGSVNVDPAVTVAPTPSSATLYCYYANSGVLAAHAGGGSSSYTYAWSNGLGSGATASPTLATATVYVVTVTDSKSCTATGSTGSVTVDPAVTVNPTPGGTTFYCSYANAGVLNAGPGGGSGTYSTYAWSGGLGSSITATPTIGLSTAYSVTVTDNKGCSAAGSTGIITVNPVLTSAPTPSGATFYCSYATTNVLAAVAGGGTSPYTYNWSNGLGTGANATPVTATAQAYSVTVTDHNLCTVSASTAVITVNPVVTANPTGLTYVCSYSNTNALAAGAGGGTPGYTYLWSNGLGTGATATPTLTTATTYTLTVTDSKNCTASASLGPVTDYAPPTITGTTPGAICGTGTVNLGATASAGVVNWWPASTGGIPPSTNTGGSYTTPIISSSTTYYVDATSNGCTTTSRTPVLATVYPTSITTGGFYYSTISGFTPPTQGTQVASTNTVNAGIVKQAISGLLPCTTYYYVTYIVTNGDTLYATGAQGTLVTATLNATIALTSGNNNQTVCYTSPISNITYTVGGGGTGAGVTGLPAGLTGNYSAGVFTISGTPTAGTTGTYNYTVTTTGTCAQTTATGTIIIENNLTATQSGGSTPVCYNSTPANFTATGSGGTGSYTYLWYLNGLATSATTSSYSTGNLTATSTVYCAVTSGTCGTVNTTGSTVSVYPAFSATISGGTSPSCYNTSPGTFTASATGGNGSYSYQWYNSASSVGGATASTYTAPALTSSNSYTCSVTSGAGCGTVATGTTPITIEPPVSSYGTVTASGGLTQTVCDNVAPNNGSPLMVSGAAGSSGSFTYQWYYQNGLIAAPSGSSLTGWSACGASQGTGYTTTSFTASGSSSNITYACFVVPASPVCGSGQWATNVVQVTVLTTGPTETSSGGANVCLNGSVNLSSNLSVVIPATYQWFSSTSPGFSSPTTIPGATSTSYTPPTSTSGTLYYEVVATFSGSGCNPATSNSQTVTVYTVPTASQSGGSSPICYNTDPGTFTASGSGGSGSFTYQWYNNSGLIGGSTSSTYDPGRLTASNTYNCTVTDVAGCGVAGTTATSITVDANLSATISGGTTPICYNTSPGTLTATGTGGTGSYNYQWYNGSGSISGATASTFAPGNLTASNSFFCAVTSGSCGTVNTPVKNITVHANLTAAITGGTSPICYNTAPGTIRTTASGGSGTYSYQWYNSSGAISGATASTYAPGNLTSSDSYYCNVTGGTCGTVNTATVAISVDGNLTASISGGTSPICYNSSPGTFTATGSGGTGSYTYLWYNNSGSISGATASTFNPAGLLSSNSYHCSVTSGSCGTVATSVSAVTVDANLTAIISGGASPICYNTSPGSYTATSSGGTGSYAYQWYNGGGSISGATGSTYTPGNITNSDSYYCLVTSGSCGTVPTSTTNVDVYSNFTTTISGGTSPICYNSNPGTFTATATGGAGGYTYQWYNSLSSIGGATGSTYAPGNLISSDSYYCAVNDASCGTLTTPATAITVYGNFAVTNTGGISPICYNTAPATFTATANGAAGGYTYQWYNNSGGISGATASTYAPGNLTTSDSYYCSINDASCGTLNTSTTAITVFGNFTATNTGGTSPICYNTDPGAFTTTAAGGAGSYTYQW